MRGAERRAVKVLREVRFAAKCSFRIASAAPAAASNGDPVAASEAARAASGVSRAASGDRRMGVSGPGDATLAGFSPTSERGAGNCGVGSFGNARPAANSFDSGDPVRSLCLFITGRICGTIHWTLPFGS